MTEKAEVFYPALSMIMMIPVRSRVTKRLYYCLHNQECYLPAVKKQNRH